MDNGSIWDLFQNTPNYDGGRLLMDGSVDVGGHVFVGGHLAGHGHGGWL